MATIKANEVLNTELEDSSKFIIDLSKSQYYEYLLKKREDSGNPDSKDFQDKVEETVQKLIQSDTSLRKPGILLGKIQSGKTRAFISIIALAFDNGYDFVIILTKGTTVLAEQTLKRLENDFDYFIENDEIQLYDIMSFPKNMTRYELDQKLIIVSKKEINNLARILRALKDTYPNLKEKKLLFIDDEADYASLSYYRQHESGLIDQGAIANSIDEIRELVSKSDFLQVTATPYSLYLQPDDEESELKYLPKKPTFTVILPEYENYVGSNFYFSESVNAESPASKLYFPIFDKELEFIKPIKRTGKADRRKFKIEDVFRGDKLITLRFALINFIVGGCIRRIQQNKLGQASEKYSFIIHTDRFTSAHAWQKEIMEKLNEWLKDISLNNELLLHKLIDFAFNSLKESINIAKSYYSELVDLPLPEIKEVRNEVKKSILEEWILIQRVNSKEDVKNLLDKYGQLKLRNPLNIFIGGQILDRGITIKNLIGFYYGRSPRKFQQDTVLQHSRMYGARLKEDLAVTRFYTTWRIYNSMRDINEFDNDLRKAFVEGGHENGVYFIRKDELGRIVPCSPNKVLLSDIVSLKGYKRFLPIGFNTDFKTNIRKSIEDIDRTLDMLLEYIENKDNPFIIDLKIAFDILDKIESTLIFEDGYNWEIDEHKAILEFISRNPDRTEFRDKIFCLVRKRDRQLSRFKEDGTFSNQPDNPETDLIIAKKFAVDIPILILIREAGLKERDWRGSPFWWPVILTPKNTPTTIYAKDIIK